MIEDQIKIERRKEDIIEELPKGSQNIIEQIRKTQEKQEEYHDKKINQKEEFKIRDKVLYYNTTKEK